MSPLLLLFLTIVLLVAKINDITYPTIVTVIVHGFSLKGLERLLFSLGGIGVRISVPIIPFLIGGMEV